MAEIEEGKALTILEKFDTQHREQQTWCVGLSWDVCDRDELAEIVEVSVSLIYNFGCSNDARESYD